MERSGLRAALGLGLLAFAVAAEVGSYVCGYSYAFPSKDPRFPVADVLRRVTEPTDVLLVFGALFQGCDSYLPDAGTPSQKFPQ